MNFPSVERVGNVRLCFALRGGYLNHISHLMMDMRSSQQQLVYLDSVANHDDVLPDEILEKAADWRLDHVGSALNLASIDLHHSLSSLEKAHQHVAGLFKGQMRDETEEALARAIKGAEQRLAKMQQMAQSYELPKRPHEIRRNALSYLIQQVMNAQRSFLEMMERDCDSQVSLDLRDELVACHVELAKLQAFLETLRERSSQKMSGNMQESLDHVQSIFDRLSNVEIHAGTRTNLPFADYRKRKPIPFVKR